MSSFYSRFGKKASMSIRNGMMLGLFVALLLVSLPAYSQLNLGHIYGTITDQSGAVIAGATLTITDVARGVSRSLTTDSSGAYSAPGLTPSTYRVRVEAKGFNTLERQDLTLGVGQELRIDLSLQAGTQTQQVVVTGELPLINTTSAVISSTLDTTMIDELPINGRLYTKLLDYTAGLFGKPGGNSPAYASNGASPEGNIWMLDGVDDIDMFVNTGPLVGAATSTDELTILPQDAIQEVNVMANPGAQYGWFQGAVVNVGLKSGTNAVHGSAYGFGRDSIFDANNPFLSGPPALPKADDYLEQFGVSLGGPIKKDKLFYFVNYEGMQYTIGTPSFIQVPSSIPNPGSPAPDLSFPDAINALRVAGVPLNQLSLNLAGCTAAGVCNPKLGVFNNGTTNTNSLPAGLDNIGTSNNAVIKIDYHPNERNVVDGEYFLGNANDNSSGNGVQPYWVNGNHSRSQAFRGNWAWIPNSTWVNQARFGYDRYNLVDYNAECTQKLGQPNYATAFGFVSGLTPPSPECGFPIVTISGFTDLGAGESLADELVWFNTYHFLDDVSYSRGKHQIKFGGEFDHTLYRGYGQQNYLDGLINFNGSATLAGSSTPLEDFLSGSPANGQILLNPTSTTAALNRYAGYIEDAWRVVPRVILTMGLRYEYEPPVVVDGNAAGNFDPNTPTGMIQQTNGHALYNPDYRDLAPHFGVAWDITGHGTTVLRGGGSMMYDTMVMSTLVSSSGANLPVVPTGFTIYNTDGSIVPTSGTIRTGAPSLSGSQINWVCNNTSTNCPGAPSTTVPVFNTTATALACGNGLGVNPPQCNIAVKAPNDPRSPMFTWSMSVDHAFTPNASLTVAYVGNHAWDLPLQINLNQPTVGPAAGGSWCPSALCSAAAVTQREPYYSKFPWLGQILQYQAIGITNYEGLQMTFSQRVTHGLSFKANYTYNHALDIHPINGHPTVENSLDPMQWYGDAPIPFQIFSLTATYNVPGIKSPGQLLEGWELSTAVTMSGATPFNPRDLTNDFAGVGNGTGLLSTQGTNWSISGSPSDFTGLGRLKPVPCYGAPGSRFARFGCSAAVPTACTNAATAEPVNPSLPGTSGLTTLAHIGCYMEGNTVIIPPAPGTFGNMGQNALLSAGFSEWDLSLFKNTKLFKERLNAQFRAEFFNVLNHREFAPPNANLFNPAIFGTSLATPNFNNPINGTGGPREVQLGLKLIF